jgi:hypothetical protein
MAIHRGPKIVTDGLVMNLDSASPKSYDPSQTGTASYIAPVPADAIATINEDDPVDYYYYKQDSTYQYYIYTWIDTPYGRSYSQSPTLLSITDSAFGQNSYSLRINVTDDSDTSGWLFYVFQDDQYSAALDGYFELTRAQLLGFDTLGQFYIDGGAIYKNQSSAGDPTAGYNGLSLPSLLPISQKNQFEFKDLTSRNNAIPVVTTYSSSNFGVLNFNSANFSRATVTGSPDFNYSSGDFTWEVWAKPTADGYFLDHAPLDSGALQRSAGGLKYYNPVVGVGSPLYTTSSPMAANAWHNVVASRISGTTSLYLNGSFKVSGSDPCVYPQASYLSLGSAANFSNFLDGQIPVLRIYKGKGLTSSEVSQNYNALKGRFGIL